jgi:hypothetical protein
VERFEALQRRAAAAAAGFPLVGLVLSLPALVSAGRGPAWTIYLLGLGLFFLAIAGGAAMMVARLGEQLEELREDDPEG